MNNVKYVSIFTGQELTVRVRQARSPYVDANSGKVLHWGGRPTVQQADVLMKKQGFLRKRLVRVKDSLG